MSMRLLMTADTAGGVWVHALSLCAALEGAGASVRLVALGTPSAEQRNAARRLGNVELVVRPVPLEWMTEPWDELDALEPELLELAASCDLVHLNHLAHGHLAWGRPVLCVVHSCVLSWFEAVRGCAAPATWDSYRRRVARSLQAADRVVAPSAWMLARAEHFYGPLPGPSVIANGSAAPMADPAAARRGILAAGRVWDEAKNLAALQRMAEHLSAPLEIIGPRRSPAAGAAGAAADPGCLPQQALWARMRQTSLFAAPALYEPFGLGVLEAARSGCALVLADIPTMREIWENAALFVDPHRPDRWERALEDLLHRPEERLRLARAAQRHGARYTLARMVRAYLALYRRAVGMAVVGAP
jgi:glycosyltransferase involved in cell wall biosynthesis